MSILAGVTTVIFSLCGAEIVTIAAAESSESSRTMSRLTGTIIIRILLFYVLSVLLVVAIVPWTEIVPGSSPFAAALTRTHIPGAATIMNLIVLTAVLSCLNSGLYVTSRTLFVLAARGDAPQSLVALNKRAGACACHSDRKRFWLCHRDDLGDCAGSVVRVPGECVGRDHADGLFDGVHGADQAQAPDGAGAPGTADEPSVAVSWLSFAAIGAIVAVMVAMLFTGTLALRSCMRVCWRPPLSSWRTGSARKQGSTHRKETDRSGALVSSSEGQPRVFRSLAGP